MLKSFLRDESGAIISAELVLVLTIVVIGVIVGLSELAVAINTELNDISNAIGALDQGFFFTGFHATNDKIKSAVNGSRFTDTHEACDQNTDCDLICGPPIFPTCG